MSFSDDVTAVNLEMALGRWDELTEASFVGDGESGV
jgi:hypothetical protein